MYCVWFCWIALETEQNNACFCIDVQLNGLFRVRKWHWKGCCSHVQQVAASCCYFHWKISFNKRWLVTLGAIYCRFYHNRNLKFIDLPSLYIIFICLSFPGYCNIGYRAFPEEVTLEENMVLSDGKHCMHCVCVCVCVCMYVREYLLSLIRG